MKLAIRFAAVGLSVAGLASAAASNTAVAVLRPTQGNTVEGKATFTTTDTGTRVRVHLTGLTPGKHAFHIHEKGDCSAPDAASAGGHFNPSSEPHAAPTDAHRHTGDLGNLEANKDGVADLDYTDPRASLDGANSILGKGVIVHSGPDDFVTQPTGNAGGRVACGVVEVPKSY
jgi:Cu-Zn family superoxide dismutase